MNDIEVKRRNWIADEELELELLWGKHGIKTIAKKLNRSISSVRNKAFRISMLNRWECE